MNDIKSVLLAGASGVFGRHVAGELTAAGHRVLSLGRGAGNDIVADLMDRDSLLRAVDGLKVDTVVHAATALREAPMKHRDMAATDALRVEGTAHLLEAARAMGARRMIVESMVFGYGYRDFGDRLFTEDDVFGPTGLDRHSQAHVDAMRTKEGLMLGADGIEDVALRFGLFYGPGGTEALVELLRKRKLPAVADRGRVLPCSGGDLNAVMELLAPEVAAWSDGGGKVTAALRPLHGPTNVARWLLGVMAKPEMATATDAPAVVNGELGILCLMGGAPIGALTFDLEDGLLRNLRFQVNPDKLRGLRAP
ncbi:NAD-dependent epimerase/dehydratase family protein [Streptomyces xanthophaeus]|uniref:NAD-dependent epimerase/dehydratase family protein n=1 Tax=Streptomyces xanthophaeus TaxID=67385 RepID=UPI00398FA62C